MIRIGRSDHLGEGRQVDLLACVVPDSPAVEVEDIAGNRWRRLGLTGETPNEPERFTVGDRIRGELVGAGRDDLCGTAGRTVNDRSGVSVDDVTWRFPGDPAALCIHGHDVRIGVLIADEDHFAIGIDGRCDDTVLTVEWSERQPPSLVAREVISGKAEIGEEDIDALSIGHRGGRRAVIEAVLGLAPAGADGSPPLNSSRRAARAQRNQIIPLGSGEENEIPHQHRGGLPRRQLRLP